MHNNAHAPRKLTANAPTSRVTSQVPGLSTATHSATASTAHVDAHSQPPNAKMLPTSVHCAAALTTGLNSAQLDPRRISSPLLPDSWETELRRHGLLEEFGDVPPGLRQGFRIGVAGPVSHTYTPPNHSSALDRPEIVQDHINSELRAGRYTGPFSKVELESLIGPFRTAPLGVVGKPSSPGKFRIIQDFSFPRNNSFIQSLNSQINTDDFPCVWGFFADVAKIVALASPGTEGATFDVDSAYRQIPVHPIDQPHIVVMWGQDFYLDHAVPFGAASSNGLFARCGDAIAIIFEKRGLGLVFKWVDDFLFIRLPSPQTTPHPPPPFTEEDIYEIAEYLGWPWKRSKTKPFSSIFTYLGFLWDLKTKFVSIPEEKRAKYIARISLWLANSSSDLRGTQVIIGSLVHCSLVIPDGRPHIAGLIKFSASFPQGNSQPFRQHKISPQARDDALWWKSRLLSGPFGITLSPPPPPATLRIHSDASSSFGIGVMFGELWSAWRLLQGWKADGRNIGWAEAVGVELAIEWLIHSGAHDISIDIHCDNQGVVQAWKAGRSRSEAQNHVIMRAAARAATRNIWVRLEYINTSENLADRPSRGIAPHSGRFVYAPFTLPSHLNIFMAPFSILK